MESYIAGFHGYMLQPVISRSIYFTIRRILQALISISIYKLGRTITDWKLSGSLGDISDLSLLDHLTTGLIQLNPQCEQRGATA